MFPLAAVRPKGGLASGGAVLPVLANAVLWVRADQGVFQDDGATTPSAVDSPVGYMTDYGGAGNHEKQSTSGARPTLRRDEFGASYLEFDGVDDFLVTDSAVVMKGIAILGRYRADASKWMLASDEADNRYVLHQADLTSLICSTSGGTVTALPPVTGTLNSLIAALANPADIFINGVEMNLDNNSKNLSGGLNGKTQLGRRSNAGASSFSFVDIYEVIVSSAAFTANERTAINAYFAARHRSPLVHKGSWTWFNTPVAVRYSGTSDRTYFGTIAINGDVRVGAINHATGKYEGSVLLKGIFQVDDHANPALLVRSDGKILAVYNKHGGGCYSRLTTNAEDISAWDTEATIDASATRSYAVLENLSGESNTVHLFSRSAVPGPWQRQKSTDGGATWDSAVSCIDNSGQRPYIRARGDGASKIHVAFVEGNPGDGISVNSLFHCYYEAGSWYKTDGALICADAGLPVTPLTATKVYDSVASGLVSWVWDIGLDATGKPVIVYAVFVNSITDHRYYYSRWTGSAWQTPVQVCTAGGSAEPVHQPFYSGGIAIYDANTLYCTRQVSSKWGIYKCTTSDGGLNWTVTLIEEHATNKYLRPNVPRGTPAGTTKALFLTGRYDDYTDFDLSLRRTGT